MTLEQALMVAIAVQAGVVSLLWVKVNACEKDRLKLWKEIAGLHRQIGKCN